LRFGHVPLEFKPLADMVIQDGIPDFSKFNVVDVVRKAAAMEHISVIELSLDLQYALPGSLTPQVIQELANLRDELGFTYTAHLPLWSVELSSFNEPVRRGSVESIVQSIGLAEPLEPESYVLHTSGALAAEFSHLGFQRQAVEIICTLMAGFASSSVEEIIAQSEIDPKRLAIENVEFPFEITRAVVDEHGTGICFDTGHALSKQSGDESVIEFYQKHKDRIIEVHLHDGKDTRRDSPWSYYDHKALGRGEMPVRDFLMGLIKDNFKHPLIFELTAAEATESLEIIKQLVPEALE
jgi:sugar phosphate isomerase/epimerase